MIENRGATNQEFDQLNKWVQNNHKDYYITNTGTNDNGKTIHFVILKHSKISNNKPRRFNFTMIMKTNEII